MMDTKMLKIGEHSFGFEIKAINQLEMLRLTMIQLVHEKTGAKLIHLANDDDNNCFAVGFKTTPTDSTGVAHILEHTALCGSKRFPVRDPFFSMIKRSMKTFMNAMTANDWTLYPFATQNIKDYYNLMDVYMDAVFHPLLSKNSFFQEGHRLEYNEPDNPDSELWPHGIVYSEMQGAMSSQSHIMHRAMGQALYPTTTYRFNSGGDPEEILNLTHERLIEFHRHYYHPSNSYFFTYGDIPLEDRLRHIDLILESFSRDDIDSSVPDESRYAAPKSFDYYYPLDKQEDDGEKCQIALGWLTCGIQEPIEVLSLQLINLILLGHAGAPLRKALLESKLGKSLADTTGFDEEYREPSFCVGLQGVKIENMEAVESLVHDTLSQVVEKGISKDQIGSAIHQIEIETKEISGGHYPYSLDLLFRFFGTWIHDGDPVSAIDFDKNLSAIKKKVETENFLENQIKKYLIDNPHRVTLRLYPDSDLENKRQKKLKQRMAEEKSNLTHEEKQKIISTTQELRKLQEATEDISCLPSLSVSDIPADIRYMAAHSQTNDKRVTFYDCPTNGITYITWHFHTGTIPEKDRITLPLLGRLLPNIGIEGVPYEEMAKLISLYTGGFSASPGLEISTHQPESFQEYFIFKSKALNQNIDKMMDIATDLLTKVDFRDMARIQTLISQRANALVNSIVQSGHVYASSLASRSLNPTSKIGEIYSGVHQIQYMRQLAKRAPEELSDLIDRYRELLRELINSDKVSIAVVGEKHVFKEVEGQLTKMMENLSALPSRTAKTEADPIEFSQDFYSEGWCTTTPVSYVAKCFKVPEYQHPDSPVLLVLANLIRSNFLHGEIREKGGAYGGLSSYNSDEGIFSLLSYRDPHLARTLDIYDQTLTWIETGNFTQNDVEEIVLQTCSNIDTPLSPAAKAMSEYLAKRKGKTKEMREKFRARILECEKEDLIRVARQYLTSKSSIAAITSDEIIKRDKDQLNDRDLAVFKI